MPLPLANNGKRMLNDQHLSHLSPLNTVDTPLLHLAGESAHRGHTTHRGSAGLEERDQDHNSPGTVDKSSIPDPKRECNLAVSVLCRRFKITSDCLLCNPKGFGIHNKRSNVLCEGSLFFLCLSLPLIF